ncbi:hypothetical protein TNCV_4005231 [Trichonephila clavipes]|nr:hypothetical protein TNCV_4005231 [Trichonephila clavipes]
MICVSHESQFYLGARDDPLLVKESAEPLQPTCLFPGYTGPKREATILPRSKSETCSKDARCLPEGTVVVGLISIWSSETRPDP